MEIFIYKEQKMNNKLIELHLTQIEACTDFKKWIEQYGTDVYTYLACNISYSVITKSLMKEVESRNYNPTETYLMFREQTIKLFNKEKNKVLLNRLDELFNV